MTPQKDKRIQDVLQMSDHSFCYASCGKKEGNNMIYETKPPATPIFDQSIPLSSKKPFLRPSQYAHLRNNPLEKELLKLPPAKKPKITSILKPGALFSGYQESGRHRYLVQVRLLEVDLNSSFISGLLTIHGLTPSHPIITTFFKGEVIGELFSFETQNPELGSSLKNDIQHWSRFAAFRQMDIDMLKLKFGDHSDTDFSPDRYMKKINEKVKNSNFTFMRWKEQFLYPDVNITDIRGASFAGFYYVCMDQSLNTINGLYYHQTSDRFQQLILSFVNDSGVSSAYEYQ